MYHWVNGGDVMLRRLGYNIGAVHKLKGTSLAFGVRWIVFLCFFDALATDVGIRMHLVSEANPFAKLLYETNVALFYICKVGLPLILLIFLPYVRERVVLSRLFIFTGVVYALLALYHMGWILYVMVVLLP
jgi:hypothetical protein